MTNLTKFEGEEVFNWDRTGSVILLNRGKYLGWKDGDELEAEIYGPGMVNKKVEDERGPCLYAYSAEGITKFKAFCEEHSVHFYADCKEDFFIQKGVDEAIAAGKKYLLAENLS